MHMSLSLNSTTSNLVTYFDSQPMWCKAALFKSPRCCFYLSTCCGLCGSIQKGLGVAFWCSIDFKCSFTMSRPDKPPHQHDLRLRGWELIWQQAFRWGPGATGHTETHVFLQTLLFIERCFGTLKNFTRTLSLLITARICVWYTGYQLSVFEWLVSYSICTVPQLDGQTTWR